MPRDGDSRLAALAPAKLHPADTDLVHFDLALTVLRGALSLRPA